MNRDFSDQYYNYISIPFEQDDEGMQGSYNNFYPYGDNIYNNISVNESKSYNRCDYGYNDYVSIPFNETDGCFTDYSYSSPGIFEGYDYYNMPYYGGGQYSGYSQNYHRCNKSDYSRVVPQPPYKYNNSKQESLSVMPDVYPSEYCNSNPYENCYSCNRPYNYSPVQNRLCNFQASPNCPSSYYEPNACPAPGSCSRCSTKKQCKRVSKIYVPAQIFVT